MIQISCTFLQYIFYGKHLEVKPDQDKMLTRATSKAIKYGKNKGWRARRGRMEDHWENRRKVQPNADQIADHNADQSANQNADQNNK